MGLISAPITAELVRGAAELEPTDRGLLPHRLPEWARAQCGDPQLARAEAQPSGVRLVLRTRATELELDTLRGKVAHRGVPPRPDGVYDLLVDGELVARASTTGGDLLTFDLSTGTAETEPGPAGTVRFAGLPDRDKELQVWLPHDERTELLELRADAAVEAVPAAGKRPVWLHHGSSVSQGSDAASPTTTWPAIAAHRGDLELINLGFGGGALLDPFTARTMRAAPADLVSVKIGLNLVNRDLMRLRAFGPAVHGFLDTIREGHPRTPLLVVSPLHCPIHEHTPGPAAPEFRDGIRFVATGDPDDRAAGKLTLSVVRDELARIVEQRRDPNLHHLDGSALYGPADFAELPLPDDLHPDADTHVRIGERFAAEVFGPSGPFPR